MDESMTGILRREEKITLALRALYEKYGYRKYRMGKFEEYELYLENKNFLKSQNIITFNALDGSVLALKPDVTLSIAKNTHATARSSEKFYYLENVYRLDKQSGSYREISQLGLEYIGCLDQLASFEVLWLAQRTLSAISDRHRMQVSHIGFWISLLDGLNISEALRREILEFVRGKRLHEMKARLREAHVAEAAVGLLLMAAALCGPFEQTLEEAAKIAINQGMTEALDELRAVYGLLLDRGCAGDMTLDFSLVSDSDYYGGIIFQGYVEGVPRAVLTGGYYGNLLKKFGKALDAIGFAVYLNELNLLFRGQGQKPIDALILYTQDADRHALLTAAEEMRKQGLRVRLDRHRPEEERFERIYTFDENGLKEAGKDA